ncbi:hypothetical protein [Brevibacterium sp.]|uniref:hypothetical protein n=1 Tax=Brevibacterium sp. TaxID=1701 RepID=UPI0028122B5D|nr:hypothetical protein [Brevibacterium sp.]
MSMVDPPIPGDASPMKGEDGVRRAKQWLEATTRVVSSYTIKDPVGANRLSFDWPDNKHSYSYDLGGVLYGEPFHQTHFVAEVKMYETGSDQGAHYDKFLAQSYAHISQFGQRMYEHFFYITWSPFRATTWKEQISIDAAQKAIIKHADKVFPSHAAATDQDVLDSIDAYTIQRLVDSVWLIVLADKQEELVASVEDRALIAQQRIIKGD